MIKNGKIYVVCYFLNCKISQNDPIDTKIVIIVFFYDILLKMMCFECELRKLCVIDSYVENSF